jgi:uncharacterized protein (TIGR00369 family)
MNSDSQRQYSFTWQDPLATAEAAKTMSGLEFLQAIAGGRLPQPPIAHALHYRLADAEPGRAVFVLDPHELQYNPIGTVHGGVVATVLDSAMSCAVQSLLPAGVGYTTAEIKINFVRPVTLASGRLQAIGTALHQGRRLATAEGRLVDAAGKLYGHGTTTCLILNGI